ncbi:hypothetical protein K6U06_15475 [Acidiferrimicrobium sp. IK]|jgi:hypothetical protein|uniref:hypothetical protein n=1 Tax=Acidiferrimicrobium sp. IK TaxID=2871700 RepID=UPI0021CB72AB|nr:hypothetical protein [Acidiferrimicrobium sp. IK]MCU4185769.1 hypothetical protein [Acidiferrimicrobium sp. IK]
MSHIFYSLAILACPAGMGVMMWMMMRGNKQPAGPADDPAKQAELARLQAQIDALRAEQGSGAPAPWPGTEQPVGH